MKVKRESARAMLLQSGNIREGTRYIYREGVDPEAVNRAMRVIERCLARAQAQHSRAKECKHHV